MIFQERTYAVLIVSASEQFDTQMRALLPGTDYYPVHSAASVGQAKRRLLETAYDLVLILTPLRDDFGSQLIRIPAAPEELHRAELRSADPAVNPYIAYALLIHAGLDGIEAELPLPPSADVNLFTAPEETLRAFRRLPGSLPEANRLALESAFVRRCLPEEIIAAYCGR